MFAFNMVLNIRLGPMRKTKAYPTSWAFQLILNNVSLKVFWCGQAPFIVVLCSHPLVHHASIIPSISSILPIVVIALISTILETVIHLLQLLGLLGHMTGL